MPPTLAEIRNQLDLALETVLTNLDWSVEAHGPDHPNTARWRDLCDLHADALARIEAAIELKAQPLGGAA